MCDKTKLGLYHKLNALGGKLPIWSLPETELHWERKLTKNSKLIGAPTLNLLALTTREQCKYVYSM